MLESIGTTAGQVWEFLSENGDATPNRLHKKLGVSEKFIYMAVGWLAREDKVEFVQDSKKNQLVHLK